MINYIGKFLLVISDVKKKLLWEERLLFYFKTSAILPGYGFWGGLTRYLILDVSLLRCRTYPNKQIDHLSVTFGLIQK